MMLQRSVFGLLYILLLSSCVHKIASNEFDWRSNGHTCDYGRCCYRYKLMCKNLTTETFAQCPTNARNNYCDGEKCNFLDIRNSKLSSVDKTILPCRLYELALINNHIHTIADDTFNDYSTIRKLNLEYNQITEIHFLGSLNNLQVLNLGYNKLEHIKGKVFDSLGNLEELYLNNNILSSIDNGAFQNLTNLRHFHLHNNKLHVILKHTLDLYNLELLDLTNNAISVIGPESFVGFPNLRHLLLNNNYITNVPLGTFKNFPHLNNLQLGNNYLSQFKTGIFSNLGELKYLNLSHNNFSTLNETVLYPLGNLDLLDLNNNNFTYINYTSLLLHLPNLHFISINDNNWTCQLLTHMLKTFRDKGVNYLFNATTRYTEENVDGINCSDSPIEHKITFPKYNNPQLRNKADGTNDSTNLIAHISGTLEQSIAKYIEISGKNKPRSIEELATDNTNKYITMEQFNQLIGNTYKITNNDPKSGNITTFSSSFYVISILMLLSCVIIICTLFVFVVYKNYFQKVRQTVNSRSELELLNTSS